MSRSARQRVCLTGVLLAAAVCAAQERKCHDVTFPEHVQINGSDLTLNGLGMRKATFLKINVYVAALYVTEPLHLAQPLIESDTPQELVLQFVRNVDAGDLRQAFLEAFERGHADQALQARIARLNSWMSDMKIGQRLAFVRLPHSGVQVSVNGAQKGTIEGEDFARTFVSIWLGPTPPNSELKAGLLGGECG